MGDYSKVLEEAIHTAQNREYILRVNLQTLRHEVLHNRFSIKCEVLFNDLTNLVAEMHYFLMPSSLEITQKARKFPGKGQPQVMCTEQRPK